MKLPNSENAVIESWKVGEYLLNPSHPDGWGKAEFLTALGFRREAWQVLADALRQLIRESPVTKSMTSLPGGSILLTVYCGHRAVRPLTCGLCEFLTQTPTRPAW